MNLRVKYCSTIMRNTMGFLDKAKALANEAADAGKRVANVVSEHVDEASKKDDRIGRLVSGTKAAASSGIEKIQTKSDEVSETESGRMAGSAVRKVGQIISGLPILSAVIDAVRAKNCVDLLLLRLQQEPHNPYTNLWLAESLIKTSQDMTKYRYAKGMIDPSSFFIGGAMTKTAEIGKDSISTDEKLLRHAWILAIRNLKKSPRDSGALDVLARVYLAKGDRRRAIATAKAAVLADQRNPIARITLGRALLADREFTQARDAGVSAVRAGSTLGYLISAEATQLESRDGNKVHVSERVKAYEEQVANVTSADRILYSGAYREPDEIVQATKTSQTEKVGKTWTTAKRWGGIVRDA
jgi:hypothetical protein